MPRPPYDFPDTPEGREAAEAKRDKLNEYFKRHKENKK
jgi:hypothetical protein